MGLVVNAGSLAGMPRPADYGLKRADEQLIIIRITDMGVDKLRFIAKRTFQIVEVH